MRRLVTILIVASIAASAGCSRRQAASEEGETGPLVVPVVTTEAQVGVIRAVVRAAGAITVPPDAEFLAIAAEPASIIEIPRAAGEMVATGDMLVRLDIPSARQEVTRQQAEVARTTAAVENARVATARMQDLVDRQLVARRDLEIAQQELVEAQSAVARAQAALAAAEAAAGRAIIRAPFPGVIVTRFHNPGDSLSGVSSDPILRFVDSSRLEVTTTMKAEDAARVTQGATARLALVTADGPPAQLTVVSRLPAPGGTDQIVRLSFAQPTTLPIETPVQVDIDAEERSNIVFVPAEAIVKEGEKSIVFVAVSNRAERREVTTGLADETRVEIVTGVRRGELVLTQGHVGLSDGSPIVIDTTAR